MPEGPPAPPGPGPEPSSRPEHDPRGRSRSAPPRNDEDVMEESVAKYMAILSEEPHRNVLTGTDPNYRRTFGVCVYTRVGDEVFRDFNVVDISDQVTNNTLELFDIGGE